MLPYLKEVQNASKKYSVAFRGINYGEGTQDGEFAETYNLSTDQFPCITQRAARIKTEEYALPYAVHAKGELLVIDGTDVLYGGKKVGEVTEGKKQIATVGNYIVIFPDKKYYRVATEDEPAEFGSMDAEYKASRMQFTNSTITADFEYKTNWLKFTTSTITFGTEYKATGLDFTTNKIYCSSATTTTGYEYFPFKAGETVTISGCSQSTNNKELVITKKANLVLTFADDSFVADEENGEVTISRKVEGDFPFKAGDTISITGCTESGNNKEIVIKEATADTLTFEEGSFVETEEMGEMILTLKGSERIPFKEGDAVTIEGCSDEGNNKPDGILIRGVSENTLTRISLVRRLRKAR